VPPPPERLAKRLRALEAFLQDKLQRTSHLLEAALARVQFKPIHPFLDGDGRVADCWLNLFL